MKTKGKANDFDIKLGELLRSARLEAGLSQEKLADAMSLTFQQIQKYESGVNRIAASRLPELAKAVGKPVIYFFEEQEVVIRDIREGVLLNAWRNLPSHDIKTSLINLIVSASNHNNPKRKAA